jgi:hypothetical protein
MYGLSRGLKGVNRPLAGNCHHRVTTEMPMEEIARKFYSNISPWNSSG